VARNWGGPGKKLRPEVSRNAPLHFCQFTLLIPPKIPVVTKVHTP